MISFGHWILLISLACITSLSQGYKAFANYHSSLLNLTNLKSTDLAAANYLGHESSNFLNKLQEHLETSSRANIVQDYQDYLNSIKPNINNELQKLIMTGFAFNANSDSKFHKFELLHIDYLPLYLKTGDKIFASTLIESKDLPVIDFANLESKVEQGRLKVNPELENLLINKNLDTARSGIIISPDGLKLSDIPNAIRIFADYEIQNKGIKSNKNIKSSAHAQLRLKANTKTALPIQDPPPGPNASSSSNNFAENNSAASTFLAPTFNNRLNLILEAMRLPQRAMIFDSSQKLSANNPIEFVNKKTKAYSAIWQDANEYIKVQLGLAPSGILKAPNGDQINIHKLNFGATANIITNLNDSISTSFTENLDLDMLPNSYKRCSVAKQNFKISGFTIPSGSIIVGTISSSNTDEIPGNRKYHTFRVYDPKTGALVKKFGQQAYRDSACTASTCFDMKAFAVNSQNNFGATVKMEYSTKDLLPQSSAYEANRIWAMIQNDLEKEYITSLYRAGSEWQQKILNDFNDDESIIFGELFSSDNTEEDILQNAGFVLGATNDKVLEEKYNRMISAFKTFALGKIEKWEEPDSTINIKALKDSYNKAYGDYQIYLKKRKDPPLEPVTIAKSTTTAITAAKINSPEPSKSINSKVSTANKKKSKK